ncbi:MAG: hypothetical protein R2737_06210 [Candidatus Nanopelagicales bacterium]
MERIEPAGEFVDLGGREFYRISDYDRMPPFFLTLVSSADHWAFVSSTGGLTAGRVSAESALFPYYTDDKVSENAVNTGPTTCLFVTRGAAVARWEPFTAASAEDAATRRNLYKSVPGDELVFEEVHHGLGLTFRYAWRTSDRFGLVRTSLLRNDSGESCDVRLLDGVRNLLPAGVSSTMQATLSNLLDAYKRDELDPDSGLGLYSLSAAITDRAEPSESLRATVAWQVGLDSPTHLVSELQYESFRRGGPVVGERDVKGRRGAYIVVAELSLPGRTERSWSVVLDVDQDHPRVGALRAQLRRDRASLAAELEEDVARGRADLTSLVASADGMQLSADRLTTAHHLANVEFNIMRGGVFADNDLVDREDLVRFMRTRRPALLHQHGEVLAALPESLPVEELHEVARGSGSPDLVRLCYEYLPLTFSRRHGDPSRPWNRFSINLRHPDGSRRLDYQGNWRDIFQNWEPLAWSFPSFVEGMVARFVDATTVDGYNPYRVTREGVEWEVPEPDNPWAHIGYWSDHQIVYLQRLLETSARFHPGALRDLLSAQVFSYADVPYRIRPYQQVLADPYSTIDFDAARDRDVAARIAAEGTDGALVHDADGRVVHVSLAEKLLLLVLVKLGNLVPGGGIWMNTQRPEWNDANNALVGKGLSVVTAAQLRRMVTFLRTLFEPASGSVTLTPEVAGLLSGVAAVLARNRPRLVDGFDDTARREFMDALGRAGDDYRARVYASGLSAARVDVPVTDAMALLADALAYVDHTLAANRRVDGLFHSYNVLRLGPGTASVGHLYPMLEGQVAVLSSGLLDAGEAVTLLRALRASDLYRADQHSYLLYPDRDLPGFLGKNQVPADQVTAIPLARRLIERGDTSVLVPGPDGVLHFHGDFRNAGSVRAALDALRADPELTDLVDSDGQRVVDLFEEVFDHSSFTGRSGTFFAYEGLGSIYWHMVSKLLLAVQENYWWARSADADPALVRALADAYEDVRAGIGFNKTPSAYGAFPTDPYSHTPAGRGAQQPGMTGQVKEEFLTRLGELGVRVTEGSLEFDPALLRGAEPLRDPRAFGYVDVDGRPGTVDVPAGGLAFTLCQTPVVLVPVAPGDSDSITVTDARGGHTRIEGAGLGPDLSAHVFRRDGHVRALVVRTRLPAG